MLIRKKFVGHDQTLHIPNAFITSSIVVFIIASILGMFMYEHGDGALTRFGFGLFIACTAHVLYSIYALHTAFVLGTSISPIYVKW